MTVILAIGAGVMMTAIAVAIGGFMLKIILAAISRSLKPTARRVIEPHKTDNNIGAMDWSEQVAA
jgi:hypothetical protein